MLRELHPLSGQAVDMKGFDLCLPVAAQFAVSQVIGQDIDDVGEALFFLQPGWAKGMARDAVPIPTAFKKSRRPMDLFMLTPRRIATVAGFCSTYIRGKCRKSIYGNMVYAILTSVIGHSLSNMRSRIPGRHNGMFIAYSIQMCRLELPGNPRNWKEPRE